MTQCKVEFKFGFFWFFWILNGHILYEKKKIEIKKYISILHLVANMISATMTTAFTASVSLIAKAAVQEAVEKLAKKYGFDPTEASEFLLSGGIVVKKQLIPEHAMPWCGKVRVGCCKGIALNRNLFTQCPMSNKDGDFCKKCQKHIDIHGTTKYGDVDSRLACPPLEYTVGKLTVVPYSVYMEKNNLTQKDVEEAADAYGLTIDPVQYLKKKRGRPTTTREMEAPIIEIIEPPPPPFVPFVPPTEEEEEEEEEASYRLTYAKIQLMSASEIRSLAEEHDIDIKEDGKLIKVSELKKLVAAALNLSPT